LESTSHHELLHNIGPDHQETPNATEINDLERHHPSASSDAGVVFDIVEVLLQRKQQ